VPDALIETLRPALRQVLAYGRPDARPLVVTL
jgi:hypothetical protein